MISGTLVGFLSVGALFLAALLLAWLDRKEKGKGNLEASKFLSRTALGLFLLSFAGGVAMTLVSGVKPREEGQVMTGKPMGGGGDDGEGVPPTASIGKIDEGEVRKLEEKIASDPKDVRSRERLGHLYLQQQDFENVFKMSHEALQIDPKSAESRVHMGMVLSAMGEVDQALGQFDQALAADPNHLEGLLFKGIVLFQNDRLKEARETWNRFMKIAKPTDTGYDRVQMFLQRIDSLL